MAVEWLRAAVSGVGHQALAQLLPTPGEPKCIQSTSAAVVWRVGWLERVDPTGSRAARGWRARVRGDRRRARATHAPLSGPSPALLRSGSRFRTWWQRSGAVLRRQSAGGGGQCRVPERLGGRTSQYRGALAGRSPVYVAPTARRAATDRRRPGERARPQPSPRWRTARATWPSAWTTERRPTVRWSEPGRSGSAWRCLAPALARRPGCHPCCSRPTTSQAPSSRALCAGSTDGVWPSR